LLCDLFGYFLQKKEQQELETFGMINKKIGGLVRLINSFLISDSYKDVCAVAI